MLIKWHENLNFAIAVFLHGAKKRMTSYDLASTFAIFKMFCVFKKRCTVIINSCTTCSSKTLVTF